MLLNRTRCKYITGSNQRNDGGESPKKKREWRKITHVLEEKIEQNNAKHETFNSLKTRDKCEKMLIRKSCLPKIIVYLPGTNYEMRRVVNFVSKNQPYLAKIQIYKLVDFVGEICICTSINWQSYWQTVGLNV